MLAAAEYLASSSSHQKERERRMDGEIYIERERRDIPIWMEREPRSFRDSRFQISFGFASAEDFSLLAPSASPLPPPLLPRNMARPLSDFPHRVLFLSRARVASRHSHTARVTTVFAYGFAIFLYAFFRRLFYFFFGVFLEELVSRMNVGCVAYFSERGDTQPNVNTTLLLLRQKSVVDPTE